ncbi:hypothetical protein TNCV_3646191 [Trichonephila clavipes]|nr:hypothetical protein TNCV_3646191 [Trichonephila clavipes]
MSNRHQVLVNKSTPKTFQILTEAYEDETLSSAHVFEWYKKFSGGRVSGEDDDPAGGPSSAITDQSVVKIRDMSEFPPISAVRLLIITTKLKY